MNNAIQFTNSVEVRVNNHSKTASANFYVTKPFPLKISQTCHHNRCRTQTLFNINITNTSDTDITDLELIDWICSNTDYCLKYIKIIEGCYILYPDFIYFYIPLLKAKEHICINLTLYTSPHSHVKNCIEIKN